MTATAMEERTTSLAALADLVCEWRDRIGRVRRGEETMPPRAQAEKQDPVSASTEQIRRLRLLVIGATPPELAAAGYVRNVLTAEEAVAAVAVEAIDVVIAPTEAWARDLAGCGAPVVVDYIEQRSILRSRAYGARALRKIAEIGKGGGP